MDRPRVLLIEPYCGGSHKAFVEGLVEHVPAHFDVLSLPPRKWKWRMRASAIHFSNELRQVLEMRSESQETEPPRPPDVLMCSDFLSLADFKSLAPEPYGSVPSIAYFHENQLTYPVEHEQERDYHFALTNITTCLAADVCCFNSEYNLNSFLDAIPAFLAKMPDFQPRDVPHLILSRSWVMAPPIDYFVFDRVLADPPESSGRRVPHIVWNHRWEHDKNPQDFFAALNTLAEGLTDFRVSIIGESFSRVPAVFDEAREHLGSRIENFGYLPHRSDYARVLADADICVSTANNEFFGMSMLEACYAGCYPVLPRRLAYKELFPSEFLYDSQRGLVEKLRALCAQVPERDAARQIAQRYSWTKLAGEYAQLFARATRSAQD